MTTVLNSVGASAITDPTDVSKILGIDLTGATTGTSTTFAFSQAANRTYAVIDTGANSQFVMSDANQTINGIKSFTTPIAATSGGTGFATYVVGDILYADTTSTLAKLAGVATGNAIISGGVGVASSWGKINLTTTVTGILPAANGGTGINTSTATNGQLLIGNGSGLTLATLTQGTGITITNGAGSITVANAGVTSWSAGTTGLTPSSATTGAVTLAGTLIAVNGGTGFSSYAIGDILYANTTTTLAKLTDVAAGSYLRSGGVSTAPVWSTLTLPNAATTGDLLFASATNTISNLADVATGNALLSGGIGVAPSWGKIGLTTHVSGILPIANGGTNSSTALNNNRIMVSSGGAIVEAAALTNGQLLIGSTGAAPVAAALTQGTGITITNGAGSITVANAGVTSWSAGTTGLTPSGATTGAVTLAGTLIAVNGGTGFSSYAIGDILYANTTTTLAKLADVATGNALISGGVGVAPSWGKIGLTTHVSGILPIANGGTNSSTALNNNRIMVSSGGSIVEAAALTNGQLLIGSTGAAPVAAALTQGTGITITNGAGSITVANAGVTSITGTANQVAASASTGAITISTPSTFIAPGTIQDTTGMKYSTTGSISAAGATQATATALTTSYNIVTTVAASTGVALPVATAGLHVEIVNKGANTLNVYPANGSGASIDGAAANAAVTLLVNGAVTYVALSATQWHTVNPPVIAGANVTITYGNGQTTVASTGGTGSPGGVNTNVQYNNSGAFGGSSAFNFVSGVNPVVNIQGTAATNQLTVGGTADPNGATVYIEVNTPVAQIEGMRTYFNRNAAGINGWITYDYDGNTPNIRLTDEDNDSPYIQFNTIGSGTYMAPQFMNIFGGRGPVAGATTGFSWKVSGAEISTMDTQWFRPPAGTTAQRPTPTAGMMRYNTTLARPETYVPTVWTSLTGVIDKSTIAQTVTATGATNLISYTLPGGTLTTDGILRIRTGGSWNNASGATQTVVLTVSYGATTLWQDTSATLATALTVGWQADLILASNNSASAQALTGLIMIGASGATVGTGNLGTDEIVSATPIAGTSAIASGSDQTIVFSVNLGSTGGTWIKYHHTIELM